MKSLLIGCGSRRDRLISLDEEHKFWEELVTLDINREHNPDVVWDLEKFPYPFQTDTFDEIHAYEVLEHTGRQGDYRFFFKQWSQFHRILKPGGHFFGTSPLWNEAWAWGDPGHTRVVQPESFVFLSQAQYQKQIGRTPMTDYRFIYKADFEVRFVEPQGISFAFVLQAIKPSRYGKTSLGGQQSSVFNLSEQ
jgi:SAM-dependent methyltransferase